MVNDRITSKPHDPRIKMATYVWTAKDQSGQTVVKEVAANTANDAQNILLSEGYTDLVLKEDDVISAVRAGFSDRPTLFGEEIKVTAKERIKHYDNSSTNFFRAILNGVNQSKYFCLGIAGLAIYQGYREHWMSVVLLGVGLLVWLVFLTCVSLPLVYYHKLIKAADWYRWDEVLSLVETLRSVRKFSVTGVPETELIRYRAKALTGLGRLGEGLAEFKQCEGRPDCPSWLYKLFLAGLYTIAKDYDKAIEYNLAAIAENPNSTAWVDLAYRYARYKHNPVKAREAMVEADKSPLPDFARPSVIRYRGVIAYMEGDYSAAKKELETAIELVEKAKSRPFRDGHLSIARAYLCCVLAKLGDLPAAKKCFAQAKAYLVATNEEQLLAECRQLIGEM
jgi:tetratricopeptide (TPR) repeat protein